MFRSFFLSRKWFLWAYLGSAVIIYVSWYQVQLLVELNAWYREFFDFVQDALTESGQKEESEYYFQILKVFRILAEWIVIAVLLHFFTQHYVFRWRTAMNDYYMSHWHSLRHIEGAAQRVQEDTMEFAEIVESLGSYFLSSILILISFIPILWDLSKEITELPWIGPVDHSLVWVAILSAIGGTAIVALAGYRLPGLYFNNQKVEAAYRKELVYGEDYADRAYPPTVQELFSNVRRNYYRLYLHYLYFNIGKYCYLQSSDIIPLVVMGPAVIAKAITFGVFQQVRDVFARVEGAFQLLIHSWNRIVRLMSIYKRLKQFEMSIDDKNTSPTTPPLYPSEGDGN